MRWLNARQAQRRYLVQRGDLDQLGLSRGALYAALARHEAAGLLQKLGHKRGTWVIVPPEYRTMGAPPSTWILDDLMRAWELPHYYIGLRSAAAMYGATHYALQTTQVITTSRVSLLTVGRERLRFIVKPDAATTPVEERAGGVTRLRSSTPGATSLDLVRFAKHAGGMNDVASTLAQMAPRCTTKGLTVALEAAGDMRTAQRLGYLWEVLGHPKLAEAVDHWLRTQPAHGFRVVPFELEFTSRAMTNSGSDALRDRVDAGLDAPGDLPFVHPRWRLSIIMPPQVSL